MQRLIRTIALLWPLWLMLAAGPLLIPAAAHIETNTDDVTQWLPEGSSERADYDRFVEVFGADQVVILSWPGASLEDERVETLAAALVDEGDRHEPLIKNVKTAPQLMNRLMSAPLNLAEKEARERLQGIFVARFGSATAMVIELNDRGRDEQKAVIDHVLSTAKNECGLARDDLRLGGNAYEATAVDEVSADGVKLYSVMAIVIGVLMALVCFRSIRLTAITLASAIFAQLLVISFIYYIGDSLNAVTIIVPTLVYVLTVSGAVHLINYYRDAVEEHGSHGAVRRMLKAGWLPCLMAAGSTAIGLASLAVSQISPVRTFGIYSAVGLAGSLMVLLTILPALLYAWPGRQLEATSSSHTTHASNWADRLCSWIIARHGWVSIISFVVIAAVGAGMVYTATSVKITRMFPEDSELLRNYTWLEENVGPLISSETLVAFDEECTLNTLERTELVADIEAAIREESDVGGTLSAATFAPEIPIAGNPHADAARAAINAALDDQREDLQSQHLLATDGKEELWRVTARIPAVHDLDYGVFTGRIEDRVAEVMQGRRQDGLQHVTVRHTGMSPLINKATGQLLEDLSNSFIVAVLLICPIMMIMLRGFFPGLLSMVPNVVPAGIIFGALGWMGQPLDIGAVLTASVALGIAVDDTFHFLTWFQRGVQSGLSRRDAVADAYRRCATAMLQTTIICGSGLAIYVFHGFVPTSRFGVLMGMLLISALIADLILLPAMLAGPLGALFVNRRKRSPIDSHDASIDPCYLPNRRLGVPSWAVGFASSLVVMLIGAVVFSGCLPYLESVVVASSHAEDEPAAIGRAKEEAPVLDDRNHEERPEEESSAGSTVTELERELASDSELDIDWTTASVEADEAKESVEASVDTLEGGSEDSANAAANHHENCESDEVVDEFGDDSESAERIDNVVVDLEETFDDTPATDVVENNDRRSPTSVPTEPESGEANLTDNVPNNEESQAEPTESATSSADGIETPMLQLTNTAKVHRYYEDGSPAYRCTIRIRGDADSMKRVKSVEYILHPTFNPNRHKQSQGAANGFPIALEIWGEFEISAIVTLHDGSRWQLRHGIELPRE